MEYFLGSLVTFLLMAYFGKKSAKIISKPIKRSQISQAYVDKLVSAKMVEEFLPKPIKKRQSASYIANQEIKVIIVEGHAYWIYEQSLFTADMVDGIIDKDTTRKVDTMTMDDVQLKRTQFIVSKLTEGK